MLLVVNARLRSCQELSPAFTLPNSPSWARGAFRFSNLSSLNKAHVTLCFSLGKQNAISTILRIFLQSFSKKFVSMFSHSDELMVREIEGSEVLQIRRTYS